jgi:hypothetical protein
MFAVRWVEYGIVVGHTAKALGEMKCHKFMIPVYDIALTMDSLAARLTLALKSKREFTRK